MVYQYLQLHLSKLILPLLLFGFFNQTQAQDTTYYRLESVYNSWVKTTRDKAKFYRPGPLKKEGDLYRVEDFYINGNLQMSGLSTSKDRDIFTGMVTWFHEDGAIQQTINYEDGYKNGPAIYYYPDGRIRTSGIYKDNRTWSGTFPHTQRGNAQYIGALEIFEYENNQRIGGMTTYFNSQQIAQRALIDYENKTIKWIYYYRSGEKIGECIRSMDSDTGYGIQIGFNMDNYQAINISDIAIIEKEELLSINTSKEEAEKIAEEAELLENEILQKDTFLTGNFRMQYKLQSYKKGILDGPVIFYNNNQEEIAKGIYKNNLPWEGQFMDGIYNDRIYSYRDGELAGKQSRFYADGNFKNISDYHHLEKGKKDGEAAKFSREGTVVAKGIFKNDTPWEGSFYMESDYGNDYKVENYKAGILNGPVSEYDHRGDFVMEKEYKDGEPTGWETYHSDITGKKHRALYKRDDYYQEVIEGEILENRKLRTYQSGSLIGKIEYDEYPHDPVLIEKYEILANVDKEKQNSTQQTERITYQDGIEHKLTYQNNLPYDGVYRDDYKKITYKKGVKSGAYVDYGVYKENTLLANYEDDLIQGTVTFIDGLTKDTSYCIYRDSLPFEGVNKTYGTSVNYKNGKRNGLATYPVDNDEENDFLIDAKKITYLFVENVADGPLTYYDENDVIIEEAFIKNDQPFEGVFLEEVDIPTSSSFGEIKYIITSYKNGKKDGLEKFFSGYENTLIRQKNYKNGELVATTEFELNFRGQKELTLNYQNGLPYAGQQITNQEYLFRISNYEDGKQSGYEYYLDDKEEGLVIDSLYFENGLPVRGARLEFVHGKYHKHFYKDGQILESRMYNYISHDDVRGVDSGGRLIPIPSSAIDNDQPVAFIKYTQNGYQINFTEFSNTKQDKMIMTIDEETDDSGSVTYFKADVPLGHFKFSKGKIISFDFEEMFNHLLLDEKGDIYMVESEANLAYHIYPNYQLSSPPSYQDFAGDFQPFSRSQTGYLFIDGAETSTCSFEARNGSIYNGSIIEPVSNNRYNYGFFKDRKMIKEVTDLTLEEAIKLVKESENE